MTKEKGKRRGVRLRTASAFVVLWRDKRLVLYDFYPQDKEIFKKALKFQQNIEIMNIDLNGNAKAKAEQRWNQESADQRRAVSEAGAAVMVAVEAELEPRTELEHAGEPSALPGRQNLPGETVKHSKTQHRENEKSGKRESGKAKNGNEQQSREDAKVGAFCNMDSLASPTEVGADSRMLLHTCSGPVWQVREVAGFARLLRLVCDTAALRQSQQNLPGVRVGPGWYDHRENENGRWRIEDGGGMALEQQNEGYIRVYPAKSGQKANFGDGMYTDVTDERNW